MPEAPLQVSLPEPPSMVSLLEPAWLGLGQGASAGYRGHGVPKLMWASAQVAAGRSERVVADECLDFDDGGAVFELVHGEGVPEGGRPAQAMRQQDSGSVCGLSASLLAMATPSSDGMDRSRPPGHFLGN
jgi:hypothetical protein